MKKFFNFILIVFLCFNLFSVDYQKEFSTVNNSSQENITSSSKNDDIFSLPENVHIPICSNNLLTTGRHEIEHYEGFSLCYREDYEQAEWVAYKLTKEKLKKVANRTDKFLPDTNISTKSATTEDYRGSGYDRGHLAPAGDMVGSYKTMKECFLMSNISPQNPKFNQGMWVKAEELVRNWAHWYNWVYVITGPILEKNHKLYKKIGYNRVVVPEYFYKVMLAPKTKNGVQIGWNTCAIIMENRPLQGKVQDYFTSIDEVERRTGLNFFSLLDDELEDELEGRNSAKK